ncbi:unnamed protein product [Rhizophagus irregularis]|uniref:Uncharacterized protein n=1 Tax=Rhizophagus irregularis TaxID=588596 RepID=A0A915ZA39_9GLOM|nr:unnamed protein product [Rhizophagus irregularis]
MYSVNDLKSASLRCYKKDDNHVNHVYVNSKLDKVITDFEKLFSTAEVKEFVDKLREEQDERGFDTACKINATSASAVKALEISLEKDVFKSAIITPLSPNHQFRKVCETILYDFFSMTSEKYMFDWIEVQADCIKDVMLLFPEFDLTLNKVDEPAHVYGAVYRQCDRVTLSESELRLDRKHFLHKVFELLYALIRAHKPNTPRLDPNSTETWEAIEIIYEDMNYDSFDDFDEYSW